ncbi:MAG: hypothetical protein ACKOCM_02575 [Cyanobacteriota bacterium]
MADCGGGNRGGDGTGLMVGLVAGTVIGAAGLGLWLLTQAEQRRRRSPGQAPASTRRRVSSDSEFDDEPLLGPEPTEGELHSKVQRLNLAIEDVRRQLETMGTDGTVHR